MIPGDDDDVEPPPVRPPVPTLLWILLGLVVIGVFSLLAFAAGSH